jgi:hypothetical protein
MSSRDPKPTDIPTSDSPVARSRLTSKTWTTNPRFTFPTTNSRKLAGRGMIFRIGNQRSIRFCPEGVLCRKLGPCQ